MKLLIITQAVDLDDWGLAFFHRWIEEFSKRVSFVTVICLKEGRHSLPQNIKIISLGKEEGKSRLKYLWRFYWTIWQERNNYDAVFVHMNPEYVVLGGWLWKLLGKKISLWYVHKHVNWKLWLAEKLVSKIFSSVPESMKVQTHKVVFVGHGIDTRHFDVGAGKSGDTKTILHVGRITKIKRIEIIIRALAILDSAEPGKFTLRLIGGKISEDDAAYEADLKKLAKSLGIENQIIFAGPTEFSKVSEYYREAAICVNAAPTGGLDKTVLESIAARRLTFTANRGFESLLGLYGDRLIFDGPADLAERITHETERAEQDMLDSLREKVRNEYDISDLVCKIFANLKDK